MFARIQRQMNEGLLEEKTEQETSKREKKSAGKTREEEKRGMAVRKAMPLMFF